MKVINVMRLLRCYVCEGAFDLTLEKPVPAQTAEGTKTVCEDGFSCAKRANEIREILNRTFT